MRSNSSFPRTRARSLRLAACALAFSLTTACTMHDTSFDSNAWKSQRDVAAQDNARGPMVAGMQQTLRAGMPRTEVVALLGEPDSRRDTTDVYELGRAPYGVDEEYYEIRYVDDKVTTHGLGRR